LSFLPRNAAEYAKRSKVFCVIFSRRWAKHASGRAARRKTGAFGQFTAFTALGTAQKLQKTALNPERHLRGALVCDTITVKKRKGSQI